MRGDLVLETPIKLFIILVAAVLVIAFLRNIYGQINSGLSDIVPQKQKEGYEVVELGDVSSSQLSSMADSCWEAGSEAEALKEAYGCYIVHGNFANINAIDIRGLSRHNTTIQIASGATAVFIDYHFPTAMVRLRS